jgi:hypothetical protein
LMFHHSQTSPNELPKEFDVSRRDLPKHRLRRKLGPF